jgi:uncharacterized protein with PIN domain
MSKPRTPQKREPDGDCTIPTHMPVSVANEVAFGRNEAEAEEIRSFVFHRTDGETVTHLEKMATEAIHDRRIEGWNVWTDKEQYWVVTNPTNLYAQKLFPSLDYTITFHIGLATRIGAREARTSPDPQRERLTIAARKWEQASEAFGHASEAEEFQVVGMRCRECLVSLARAIASPAMVPAGVDAPKAADFVNWSELIANHLAKGPSSDYVRGYLKGLAKPCWQLVSWLTHTSPAMRFDAQLALDATQSVLSAYAMALFRFESNAPERCPKCNSYRMSTIYEPAVDSDQEYFTLCQACGWNDIPNPPAAEASKTRPRKTGGRKVAK